MAGLLMTRPRNGAERFVNSLPPQVLRDFPPVFSPLIRIEIADEETEADGIAGLIFTSANGVVAAAPKLTDRNLPTFCVGHATQAAANSQGWQARCLGENADALVRNLLSGRPATPLLHLHGRHARGDIAERLTAAGLLCRAQVVYDQVLQPLTTQAIQLLGDPGPVIVPVFSPRTARQFAKLCPDTANIYLIALSDAVAEPLKHLNFQRLVVAAKPDAAAMADAVAKIRDIAV